MKKIILVSSIVLSFISMSTFAQSGTNSPYSQYGLGVLSDQSQGFNRGMNGLSLGLRYNNQVNALNPASYSAIDSLTMVFDVGLSGQITNFEENGVKRNANNSDFEYAVAAFRLFPNVGLSLGLIPFTNVGYNYSNVSKIGSSETTSTETHSGSGGFHQAYLGAGWNFIQGLSIGANFSYLWGSYDKKTSVINSDGYVNTVVRSYSATVNSYKLDFGLQWESKLSKYDKLIVGTTFGIGHKLGSDPETTTSISNSQTGVSSDTTFSVKNGLSIPTTFGIGLAFNHADRIIIGVDYSLQKWGTIDFPTTNERTGEYVLKDGLFNDRHKITVGGEWIPDDQSRRFFNKIRYRIGASYATPYVKINGVDGPKEYSVSAGMGIPISNAWNNRSFLNISGQWVHSDSKAFITENMFRINIGITFNERWFMKWKVK